MGGPPHLAGGHPTFRRAPRSPFRTARRFSRASETWHRSNYGSAGCPRAIRSRLVVETIKSSGRFDLATVKSATRTHLPILMLVLAIACLLGPAPPALID